MEPTIITAKKLPDAESAPLVRQNTKAESTLRDTERLGKVIPKIKLEIESVEIEIARDDRAAAHDQRAASRVLGSRERIERLGDLLAKSEGDLREAKTKLCAETIKLQDLVQKYGQPSFEGLLDTITTAILPFFDSDAAARQVARQFPIVRDFGFTVLQSRANAFASAEVLCDEARLVLTKANALINGSEIFSYPGCEPPRVPEKAAA